MNYKELNGCSIRDGFNKFHQENPHVYKAFEEQAFKAINRGRTKISSKLIINWIRWHDFLESNDQNFKINDAYQSYYARHFIAENPQHSEIFEFRRLRNEESGPYLKVDEDGQCLFL